MILVILMVAMIPAVGILIAHAAGVQVKLTIAERMLRLMHERLEALEGKTGRYTVTDDPIDGAPALAILWKGEKEHE